MDPGAFALPSRAGTEAGDGMATGPPERDLYEVLGVEPTGSAAEITSAYRRLVRDLHPDSHPAKGTADRARLADVLAAYQVLRDPQQRASYDADRRRRATANRPGGIPIPVRHIESSALSMDDTSLLVGPVQRDPLAPTVGRSGTRVAGSSLPADLLSVIEALFRRGFDL